MEILSSVRRNSFDVTLDIDYRCMDKEYLNRYVGCWDIEEYLRQRVVRTYVISVRPLNSFIIDITSSGDTGI